MVDSSRFQLFRFPCHWILQHFSHKYHYRASRCWCERQPWWQGSSPSSSCADSSHFSSGSEDPFLEGPQWGFLISTFFLLLIIIIFIHHTIIMIFTIIIFSLQTAAFRKGPRGAHQSTRPVCRSPETSSDEEEFLEMSRISLPQIHPKSWRIDI